MARCATSRSSVPACSGWQPAARWRRAAATWSCWSRPRSATRARARRAAAGSSGLVIPTRPTWPRPGGQASCGGSWRPSPGWAISAARARSSPSAPGCAPCTTPCRQAGAPCELLSAGEVARRFPAIRTGGPALLEPESCVIAADEALAALAAGVAGDPHRRPGRRLSDDGRQVTLRTSSGPVTARIAMITAGPWSGALLATLGVACRPADAGAGRLPATCRTATTPRCADLHLPRQRRPRTGCRCRDRRCTRSGSIRAGRLPTPTRSDQSADAYLLARCRRSPASSCRATTRSPPPTERCIYDNSPDEDFVVDRIGNVVVGSGTSGHGFKFGPLFGEWLAELATGQPGAPADQRFALSRFASAPAAPLPRRG